MHPDPPHTPTMAAASVLALGVLTVLTFAVTFAVTFTLTALHGTSPMAAIPGSPRPELAIVPSASPAPAPTPFRGRCHRSLRSGPYCLAYIGALKDDAYPAGSAVVLRQVTVVDVGRHTFTVTGGPICSPKLWCAQTPDSLLVLPPVEAAMPHTGEVIDLYGRVTRSGLTPLWLTGTGKATPSR